MSARESNHRVQACREVVRWAVGKGLLERDPLGTIPLVNAKLDLRHERRALGQEEIRKVVTGLIQRRDDNKAKGLPSSNLHHVISNVRITFPKPGEALHQSYWQTVRRDKDGAMVAAAMGRSEDRLVKRNGKWLIQSRKLTVFTD